MKFFIWEIVTKLKIILGPDSVSTPQAFPHPFSISDGSYFQIQYFLLIRRFLLILPVSFSSWTSESLFCHYSSSHSSDSRARPLNCPLPSQGNGSLWMFHLHHWLTVVWPLTFPCFCSGILAISGSSSAAASTVVFSGLHVFIYFDSSLWVISCFLVSTVHSVGFFPLIFLLFL